jgi:spore maturation protein CgeB
MRFVYFTHSLVSCWNNGNAHFQRGVLRALLAAGHEVRSYETEESWSRLNLLRDYGAAACQRFASDFPDLAGICRIAEPDLDRMLDGAEAVIVHEWNDPALVAAIGAKRTSGGRFLLFFHDTHHRAVSDPAAIHAFDLNGYDAVLAFGGALAEVYRRNGWGSRCFTWHEAADTRLFRPPSRETHRAGIVWVGNWGDEERSQELRDFLLAPALSLALPLDIYGVRYPLHARAAIAETGAHYRGWLPNAEAPAAFARHAMTVHVPRRFYATRLPGIPTIRVFEALACGIPLLSAPWSDAESLFTPGRDFLMAGSPEEMRRHMRDVASDSGLRRALASAGLAAIASRHTCDHRAEELLGICARLRAPSTLETA